MTPPIKPQIPRGFRDFLPPQKALRQKVIKTIQQTFEQFGFEPLETPALEYASLLEGKYGEEGDKLIYKFTDRGGRAVAISEPSRRLDGNAHDVLTLPEAGAVLNPLLATIPLQLLSYRVSVGRGFDPDFPRNLSKTLTVD